MNPDDNRRASRRGFLRSASWSGMAGLAPLLVCAPATAGSESSLAASAAAAAASLGGLRDALTMASSAPVGTSDWQLSDPVTDREIEGYASAASINLGDTIHFHVSTADPSFTLEVFRLGWYDGAGALRVSNPVTLKGQLQETPAPDAATGLLECRWSRSYSLTARTQRGFTGRWRSGVYLAKLTGSSGKQTYIKFIVRDDARTPDLMFQSSVTTDQAYNNWPGIAAGGRSLYDFNSAGRRGIKVSFNRPYGGHGAGFFFGWEHNMLRFLEREGYDVGYCTSIDTHERPSMLPSARAFLSVGHDEYWSYEMRINVERALARGVHLGFFSANTCYWKIRFESSLTTGARNRTIVTYKDEPGDPPTDPFAENPRLTTVKWRDPRANRPEDALLGVMYFLDPVDGDIVVDKPEHWVFANTGLLKGDRLPGLLGYEVDRIGTHSPANLVRLCHSPAFSLDTGQFVDESDMTIYTARGGAQVFAAGTIQWSWGLDSYGVPPLPDGGTRLNPAAQQITRNVLDRFID